MGIRVSTYECIVERARKWIENKNTHNVDSTFIHILNEWLWCVDLFYGRKRSFFYIILKFTMIPRENDAIKLHKSNASTLDFWRLLAFSLSISLAQRFFPSLHADFLSRGKYFLGASTNDRPTVFKTYESNVLSWFLMGFVFINLSRGVEGRRGKRQGE